MDSKKTKFHRQRFVFLLSMLTNRIELFHIGFHCQTQDPKKNEPCRFFFWCLCARLPSTGASFVVARKQREEKDTWKKNCELKKKRKREKKEKYEDMDNGGGSGSSEVEGGVMKGLGVGTGVGVRRVGGRGSRRGG